MQEKHPLQAPRSVKTEVLRVPEQRFPCSLWRRLWMMQAVFLQPMEGSSVADIPIAACGGPYTAAGRYTLKENAAHGDNPTEKWETNLKTFQNRYILLDHVTSLRQAG